MSEEKKTKEPGTILAETSLRERASGPRIFTHPLGHSCEYHAVVIESPGNIPLTCAVYRILTPPEGKGNSGTILFTAGGSGKAFYYDLGDLSIGKHNMKYMFETFLNSGYKLVEIRWPDGIWVFPYNEVYGARKLAVRYARLAKYIYETEHKDKDKPFIALGNCGGSSQIVYSLCYYGLGDCFKRVILGSPMPPCPRITQVIVGEDCKEIRLRPSNQDVWDNSRTLSDPDDELLDATDEINKEQEDCQRRIAAHVNSRAKKDDDKGKGLDDSDDKFYAEWKEPILFDGPVFEYSETENIYLFCGENEKLDFITKMAEILDGKFKKSKREELGETGHKIYDSEKGVDALIASVQDPYDD